MNDWIGLAVIGFLVLCGVFGLLQISKPYNVTTEEFERRAKEGPGLLGASLIGLQSALDPGKQKSVQAVQELKEGLYDGEQESGDPPEPGDGSDDKVNN